MLVLSLTYLQVMPEFVDLLLPLGERIIAQDFFSNSFYQHTRLSEHAYGLQIPERARSGRDFQVCYSLKSIERSEVQTDWPWSIRHCATHHAFDISNVRSSWMIVKGNRGLQNRITSATSGRGPPVFSSYDRNEKAFAASLSTHLIMIDCSAENWRWYINFLEEKFREITEGAISTDADIPMSPKETEDIFALGPRTNTEKTFQTQKSRTFSFHTVAQKANNMPIVTEVPPPQQFLINPRSGKKQPLPPGTLPTSPAVPKPQAVQHDIYGQPIFRFRHLQDIQDFEERANETVLVLKLNMSICKQVLEFYRSLFQNKELPEAILNECQGSMLRFERRIEGVQGHLDSQILRVKALLRLIADRKTLVSQVFPFYKNGQWNDESCINTDAV